MIGLREPGEQLEGLCSSCEAELLLCAPFVKQHAVRRLLARTSDDVQVTLVTRWRPEEVAAGVSDLEVLDVLTDRGGRVLLCDRLHAKYFRADTRALVGSANVTGAALGWSQAPNLELLVDADATDELLVGFEQWLLGECVEATADLALEIAELASQLQQPLVEETEEARSLPAAWLPQLREPHDLLAAYARGLDRLSSVSQGAAQADLEALQLPNGLGPDAVMQLVRTRLRQRAAIDEVDEFLLQPRRFGEVRDLIASSHGLDGREATRSWQTLMRWLMFFAPDRYEYGVPRHSEIFQRTGVVQ